MDDDYFLIRSFIRIIDQLLYNYKSTEKDT